MATPGTRLTQQKRLALATCIGLLVRASDELDRLIGQGRERGLELGQVEELAPAALRVSDLRKRRQRLEAELRAIAGEWAA